MLSVAVAIASTMSAAAVAHTDESSFRCPTDRSIKLGDPLFEAKGICGDPTHVVQRNEREKVGLKARHISGTGRDFIEERMINLEVEEWYYDLGSKRRSRILRFENGRLATISFGKFGGGAAPGAAGAAGASNDVPDAGPK